MRVFIVYDELGNLVSAGQFEEMHEGIEQPFHLDNPKHAVVELDSDDENFKALAADKTPGRKKGLLKIHSEYKVDKKSKRLLRKDAAEAPVDKPPVTPKPLPQQPQPTPKPPPVGKNPNQPGETPPTKDPTNPTEVSEK
jgi:hypothetical protein